ncbi:hypothetical protein J6590_043597 [Homalodisca vitripennis]|nr:hypothetical protein J6590_043597 [Homalodisca vitripennis]
MSGQSVIIEKLPILGHSVIVRKRYNVGQSEIIQKLPNGGQFVIKRKRYNVGQSVIIQELSNLEQFLIIRKRYNMGQSVIIEKLPILGQSVTKRKRCNVGKSVIKQRRYNVGQSVIIRKRCNVGQSVIIHKLPNLGQLYAFHYFAKQVGTVGSLTILYLLDKKEYVRNLLLLQCYKHFTNTLVVCPVTTLVIAILCDNSGVPSPIILDWRAHIASCRECHVQGNHKRASYRYIYIVIRSQTAEWIFPTPLRCCEIAAANRTKGFHLQSCLKLCGGSGNVNKSSCETDWNCSVVYCCSGAVAMYMPHF